MWLQSSPFPVAQNATQHLSFFIAHCGRSCSFQPYDLNAVHLSAVLITVCPSSSLVPSYCSHSGLRQLFLKCLPLPPNRTPWPSVSIFTRTLVLIWSFSSHLFSLLQENFLEPRHKAFLNVSLTSFLKRYAWNTINFQFFIYFLINVYEKICYLTVMVITEKNFWIQEM